MEDLSSAGKIMSSAGSDLTLWPLQELCPLQENYVFCRKIMSSAGIFPKITKRWSVLCRNHLKWLISKVFLMSNNANLVCILFSSCRRCFKNLGTSTSSVSELVDISSKNLQKFFILMPGNSGPPLSKVRK